MVLYGIGWAVVYVAVGVSFVRWLEWSNGDPGEDAAKDGEVFGGIALWPIFLTIVIILALGDGMLWLVRHPPRRIRKQRQQKQEAAAAKAEAEKLEQVARELNLPTLESEPTEAATRDAGEYLLGNLTGDELYGRALHRAKIRHLEEGAR